jgi:hypothetical protein
MTVSAKRIAGIIRHVLPKKYIDSRSPPIVLGSREDSDESSGNETQEICMDYRIILILCTMYSINGVRLFIASIAPLYNILLY